MKTKFIVIFTNELDINIITGDFYQILLENIIKLKNKIKIDKWHPRVYLSWYKYSTNGILACACLDTSKPI